MNATIHLHRWLAALALLALPALGAGAQTNVFPANGADLTDVINNAQANTRIRLDGNSNYTINGVVLIQENRNSPILIEGPGGINDDRPDNVRIQMGTTGSITVEQNAKLTLDSVGLYGGAPGVQVAVGATLNLANAYLSQGSPSVLIPFGGGSVNAASSVFARCNRAIIQSGGVTNIVQCTFVETAPASILFSGGVSTVVASLFAGPGDAPIVLGSATAVGNWHGNLIEQNTAAPVGYSNSNTAAPPRTDPIVFSTDADAWPGKLDEAQTPLLASGVTATATQTSITEALDAVAGLVKSDFEGDRRANTAQVGADELGAGQLAGWISGLITVIDGTGQPVVNGNGLTVAGKNNPVFIQVETRGINLSTALLRVVPQLGNPNDPEDFEEYPINELSSGFGQVNFNAPSETCMTVPGGTQPLVWDGRAEIYIRSGNTLLEGDDNNLADFEYQFIIDTTPPVLGFDPSGIAYDQLRLANVVTSNDRNFSTPPGFAYPNAWGPLAFNGLNPGNEARFGVNDSSQTLGLNRSYPQHVYFDGPLNVLDPFEFTLPLEFFDAPPVDCTTGLPVSVETAGFLPGAAPITVIADAYVAVDGDAFLSGSPPAQLSAGSFLQTSTAGTRLSTFDTLDVEWAFGNLVHDTSWRVVLNPSAADIAGNLFNSITGPGFHRDMEFWCLEETDLTAQNVSLQGPGNPESPSFSWSINRSPSPNRTMVDTCQQLVAFRLWRVDPTDSNRLLSATEWSSFDSLQEINAASEVQGDLLGDRLLDPLNVDQNMLLMILVADEAGNLSGNLPSLDTVAFPQSIQALNASPAQVNFSDFADEALIPFVYWTNTADLGADVDTRIRAKLFWNRVDGDAALPINVRQVNTTVGERDFGSSTRIPLPPRDTCGGLLSRVEGQFYLTAEGQNASENCRVIRWELLEDSRVVAVGGMRVYRETGYTGILQVPEDIITGALNETETAALYDLPFQMVVTGTSPSNIPNRRIFRSSECPDAARGDRLGDEGGEKERRRDVKYMLRASTLNLVGRDPLEQCDDAIPLLLNLPNVSEDSSPATFQFTVTPGDDSSVSAGEQPVKIQTQR